MKIFTTKALAMMSAACLATPAFAWQPETVKLIDGFQTNMVAADFNNNGYLDLYYAGNLSTPWMLCPRDFEDQHISVMAYNNGDGTFTFDWTEPVNYNNPDKGDGLNDTFLRVPYHNIAPSVKNQFLAADFNNDGNVDLVRICKDSGWGGNHFWGKEYGREVLGDFDGALLDEREEYRMALYYNNGDGTFTKASHDNGLRWDSMCAEWDGWRHHRSLSAGDYNRDGYVDLLVSYRQTNNDWKCTTELYRNNGDGTFTLVNDMPFADYFGTAQFGDFNNDGLLDVVTVDANVDNRLRIFLNDGNGGFAPAIVSGSGHQKARVLVNDFDNDGQLEIYTDAWTWLPSDTWGWFGLFHKLVDGQIVSTQINVTSGYGAGTERGIIFDGDINGDGILDLSYTTSTWSEGVRNFISDGQGNYNSTDMTGTQVSTDETFGTSGYAADFTNNGLLDIVVTKERDTNNREYFNPNGTRMYVNDGAPVVEMPQAVKNVNYVEEGNTLTVNWVAADNAPANIRYNLHITFTDGSEYTLVPADPKTGFIKLAEGRQVLLSPYTTSYTLDLTGRKQTTRRRAAGDTKVVSKVSVQAVSPVNAKASTFVVSKDNTPTGIDQIAIDNDAQAALYYNLQGIQVAQPVRGESYILRQGAKVTKIVY